MGRARKSSWILTALGVFALLAVGGLSFSTWLFSRWSDVRTASGEEARALMDSAAESAGGDPYMEIGRGGHVTVHREMEGPDEQPLSTLHILGFDPGGQRIYSTDLPWWFVRAKMTRKINLGTLATALARDWESLDLSVTEDDLERRGPGLILDHRLASGGRLVVWTE